MITIEKLTRRFGPKTAVDNVSFTVEKGQVLGFLGPNGAGKTTTMRMITGYLEPSSGSINIGGVDMQKEPMKAKAMIGYLPEQSPAYKDMTSRSFLAFAASLRGLSGAKAKEAVDRVITLCHLEKVVNQSIDTLSKGFVQRVCFAQAIVHDPPVLIMDEPTDGLDPNQKHEVRRLICEMSQNKTIIISTHILEEVEVICSRVIIIAEGKIVAEGTPLELKARSPKAGTLVVGVKTGDASAFQGSLRTIPHVQRVDAERDTACPTLRIHPDDKDNLATLAAKVASMAAERGLVLSELRSDPGRLDEVFRKVTLNDVAEECKAS